MSTNGCTIVHPYQPFRIRAILLLKRKMKKIFKTGVLKMAACTVHNDCQCLSWNNRTRLCVTGACFHISSDDWLVQT